MLFSPAIETMPLEKLRTLQNERLRTLVAYVYARVPFYKNKFDEAGLHPDAIKGVEDMHLLPFTHKHDLRDNYPFGMFAVPEKEISRIHCSTGTTGKPTVAGYTAGDIEIFAEVMARSLAAGGCMPGMKLHNTYGYGLFTGGLGFHYGAEKLGMTVIPVASGMTDRQILLLRDFKPEVMCATPSYAQTLAEEIYKRGISPEDINLKHALLGAEPWTETIRQHVEKGLGVDAVNVYGLSEIIGPGVSAEDMNEKGTGSYIWEDHFFPEVVDKDTGEPLPYGEYGVLVLTTLTKKGMPLIRYRTNDITNIYYDESSKRTHIKMGSIRGRADDMLIIRGVNFFHTQIEEILKDIENLSPHYEIKVFRSGSTDEVEVNVEISDGMMKGLDLQMPYKDAMDECDAVIQLRGHFAKKIKDNIGLNMAVQLLAPGDIPRSEGGKLIRVKDMRRL